MPNLRLADYLTHFNETFMNSNTLDVLKYLITLRSSATDPNGLYTSANGSEPKGVLVLGERSYQFKPKSNYFKGDWRIC